MPRGGRKIGDYEPDRPTDYAFCARAFVKCLEMQATEHAQARACWAAAVDAYRRGMTTQAHIHLGNRRARLLLAAACGAEKRKWRRLYAAALANAESALLSNGVAPSAQARDL